MRKQSFILLIFGLFMANYLIGQSIYTDRPTVTTSPNTLSKHWFQLESGFQYQVRDIQSVFLFPEGTKVENFSYNTTLLRYGLTNKFELRFTQDLSLARIVNDGETLVEGDVELAPTRLGFKWNFLEGQGAIPKVSFLFNYGNTVFTSGASDGFIETALLFNSVIFEEFNLDYNLGFLMENNINFNAFNYSVVLSRSVNEKMTAFVETFGFFEEGLPDTISFDAGLMYLISDTFQADLYLGTGFSELSPNLLFGFGLSKLFLPKK